MRNAPTPALEAPTQPNLDPDPDPDPGPWQVFDAGSRGVLRQFKAHKRPTRVARFAPDKLHVLSGSDDVTVRWWDVTSGAQLMRLDGHRDYVRAAAVSPASPDTWATGGYDHTVKLWDVRAGGAAVMDLDHGAPVEDLAFFPTGAAYRTVMGCTAPHA
jgi:U3 small nucleolar RNA-associated protein 15